MVYKEKKGRLGLKASLNEVFGNEHSILLRVTEL